MYLPGLTEVLIVKGFVWISHHLTTTALAKLASYAISHGVLTTISSLAPLALTASFTVGGVIWAGEKVKLVNDLLLDIKKGDARSAALKIIRIASILHTSCDQAGDAIANFLHVYYGNTSEVGKVCETIKEIARRIER